MGASNMPMTTSWKNPATSAVGAAQWFEMPRRFPVWSMYQAWTKAA